MGLIRDAGVDYSEAVAISYANVGSATPAKGLLLMRSPAGGRPAALKQWYELSVCGDTQRLHIILDLRAQREKLDPRLPGQFPQMQLFFLFLPERELFGKLAGEDHWKTQEQSFVPGVFSAHGVRSCNICAFAETYQLLVLDLSGPDGR